jgi:hypothetical protein
VRPPAKLAAFAATLPLLFGGGALAGAAIDPDRDPPPAADAQAADPKSHGAHRAASKERETMSTSPNRHTQSGGDREREHAVRGLAVAHDGLRLIVDDPELRRGQPEDFRFRIVDQAGHIVRDFDVEHEKRMHLIVARRDLTGFQHLHPEQSDDGSWTVPLRLPQAGSYRAFADFTRQGEAYTLAADLRVDGSADLEPLPPSTPTSTSDGGYAVRVDRGHVHPGEEAELRFAIAKDGQAVHTEPYLGAGGHLVALREGDLAFLHVHPTEHGHSSETTGANDDTIGFSATFPSEGRYRLFLQFKHGGRVQTVAFTQEVG